MSNQLNRSADSLAAFRRAMSGLTSSLQKARMSADAVDEKLNRIQQSVRIARLERATTIGLYGIGVYGLGHFLDALVRFLVWL